MPEVEEKEGFSDKTNSKKGPTQEFFLDFLSSLVPGVTFLVFLIPAFLLPLIFALQQLSPEVTFSVKAIDSDAKISMATVLFLVGPAILTFLTLAYVAGHIFYRQDPKIADIASFKRLSKVGRNKDGMVREINKEYSPVEFPYHFLRSYLEDRGISYLAELVPWGKGSKTASKMNARFQRRAKHFANALKIRIQLSHPEQYFLLARNEAHVRLSSSMWYVAKTLLRISYVGFLVMLGVMLKMEIFLVSCFLPIVVGFISFSTMWAVEHALHYQREREILFILETAHCLFINDQCPKLFYGISDKEVNSSSLIVEEAPSPEKEVMDDNASGLGTKTGLVKKFKKIFKL